MSLRQFGAVFLVIVAAGCMMPGAAKKTPSSTAKVERGDVSVEVVETGSLDADKTVEVKSRVSGRVKKLYVDEGDFVKAGQLIAEIDPQETQLQVDQNKAQVAGAVAGEQRQQVELEQRRVTAANALEKAKSNLRQLTLELKAQPTLTRASVTSAKSAYDAATKSYDQLVQVTQPNAKVATEIALKDAQNNRDNAENELNRLKSLMSQGYVAQRDVDNATLQAQLARTKLSNAQENLDRLDENQRLERDQSAERVKQAKADLDRATANTIQDTTKREEYLRAVKDVGDAQTALRDVEALKAAQRQQGAQIQQLRSVLSDGERQLRETRILSPIDGIVTKKLVQEGELVASLNSFSAGTTIVRIEDRSKMVVKLDINEIDVAKLTIGTRAEVTVDAFPKQTFSGHVTKIAPASDTVGTTTSSTDVVVKYQVEVTLDDSDAKLKSGMSAKCTMKVMDKKDVLRLPLEYVGKDDKGNYVRLAPKNPKDPKDKGTRVDVTIGAQSSTQVEITKGVTEGQDVVKPDYTGPARKGMMSVKAED